MSGFDDIINNLDQHLQPKFEPRVKEAPGQLQKRELPNFKVGDIIRIRETRWPQHTGKVNKQTGLYSKPGYPKLPKDLPEAWDHDGVISNRFEVYNALREELIGNVVIGDTCRIHAIWCCEDDDKWYYFIDNGRPNGKGWTRCSFRFEHINEDKRSQY